MNPRDALKALVDAFHSDEDEVRPHAPSTRASSGAAFGDPTTEPDTAAQPSVADRHAEASGRDNMDSSGDSRSPQKNVVDSNRTRDDVDSPADTFAELDNAFSNNADDDKGRAQRAGGGAAAAAAEPDDGEVDADDDYVIVDGHGDGGGDHVVPDLGDEAESVSGIGDGGGNQVVPGSDDEAESVGGLGDGSGKNVVTSSRPVANASSRAQTVQFQSTRQTTLQTTEVVRHLLWHKAMADFEDDGGKLSEYVGIVQQSAQGEHVSIRDAFHRDLAIAFELVMQHHMDPWDLDLSRFAQLYLKEAAARGVDLVTAGRIILMAWTVLKLQSDEVAEKAVFLQEPEEEAMGWDDVPDWSFGDDAFDYTQRVTMAPRAPIDEKIRHKGDRRVTLMELIHAFEEVHQEAEERQQLNETRLQNRLSLQRRMRGKVGNMMHTEDLQAEIAETWQRILEYPSQPIPFSGLHEKQTVDLVQTFTGILFLAKDGRITVSQEEFPHGEIWLTPRLPEVEDAVSALKEVHE